jgi:predicted small lipoprotein YifL
VQHRTAAVAVTLALALALAACGKKGDPEYPAGTQKETVTRPDGSQVERPEKPNKPFVLDKLLN